MSNVAAVNAFKFSSVNMALSHLRLEDLCSPGIFCLYLTIVPEAEQLLVRKSYP